MSSASNSNDPPTLARGFRDVQENFDFLSTNAQTHDEYLIDSRFFGSKNKAVKTKTNSNHVRESVRKDFDYSLLRRVAVKMLTYMNQMKRSCTNMKAGKTNQDCSDNVSRMTTY